MARQGSRLLHIFTGHDILGQKFLGNCHGCHGRLSGCCSEVRWLGGWLWQHQQHASKRERTAAD